MANAQYPTQPSKIFVVLLFDLGMSHSFCASTSLSFLEENHYLSIPSPLARILPPLPSAEWPIWRSESRIVLLAILKRPRQLLPLSLLLWTR
jgi:hypothetical protein